MRYTLAVVRRAIVGDFRLSLPKTGLAFVFGRRVLIASNFSVRGIRHIFIAAGGRLLLGTPFYGFADRHTRGLFRVRGRLVIAGYVKAAAGCRFDIGPHAVMVIGSGTYFSPNVVAVVTSGLTIGRDCAIGWDVQFLDDDFHHYRLANHESRASTLPIEIGDHVWIGNGARIAKGVRIASGCVVAAGALVIRSFENEGRLIGGVPATELRDDVFWD